MSHNASVTFDLDSDITLQTRKTNKTDFGTSEMYNNAHSLNQNVLNRMAIATIAPIAQ